ncbi:MAG: hypothetical protein CL837_05000 [Crocinitomicaceae bacterium]|jgi:hypothetical protein|nr:hypothetical protein [Crocinitomicaceae bacterium]|tara:strand:- start:366 stop:602 length:237 start_codon:yes stop_codon:yes gene_type:complete
MKISLQLLTASLLLSLSTSCGGWSKKDKEIYLTECKRAKLDSVFCNCSLEKIVEKYTSFEEAMRNEEEFPEILISCKK